ncbi:MAG: hydroxymethylpyrimidine/phosphomethylpyrimidine kinase [Silanimonas sp.]|nr:MAG: hydroxymethylpyrimidine/phosphomethylpyrimidine kinase [Silanimonas sp.]GIX39325.1 MAG: hydroxymethylpyrimidine/phosphomethylpyrimidine kinase [Silanimonas sp.]
MGGDAVGSIAVDGPRTASVLSIAGSDSGGGAGIQADLKTFAAHGVHGLSAIAALTAQHTRGVTAVHVPDPGFLRAQIDACFEDFDIRAVKLGMLATAEIIHAVADALEHWRPAALVVDPVMVATSGAKLLADDALDALRRRLLPMASVLTPNLPEAELLLGRAIGPGAEADAALADLLALGPEAVLLKGGHLAESEVVDRFGSGVLRATFRNPRLPVEGHGTGCTLASAIAARLALGESLVSACRLGTEYIAGALAAGYRPGLGGVVVLDHFWRFRDA